MRTSKYEYDAFISHAVEDKIPIANELCARLEAAGLRIWYSGKELGVGDSIEKTIEKGLNRSRYGIVIFSPTYLAKNWTIREFYTLLAKEIEEHKVILPVLYNISLDDLKNRDLLMADRFAVNADKGMDVVVDRLVREIRKGNMVTRTRAPWLSKIRFLLMISLLANAMFLGKVLFPSPKASPAPPPPQPVRYSPHPDDAAELIHGMQAMLRELSGCTCDNAAPGGNEGTLTSNRQQRQNRKMTMAVVFQMEDAHEQTTTRERVVSPAPEAREVSVSTPPFIAIQARNDASRPATCATAMNRED